MADMPTSDASTITLKVDVKKRLEAEGRWHGLDGIGAPGGVRDRMMKDCRRAGMSKVEAQAWTYDELDRLYPPILTCEKDEGDEGSITSSADASATSPPGEVDPARPREPVGTVRDTQCQTAASDSSRVQGLSSVPAAWLPLPANASLAAEIGWVQANRLTVVEERGQLTIVHLDRAHEPAPSRAAIGWLETSIRSYAKFVDVASKCMSSAEDEQQDVRRERMAIAEIDALLAEMHDEG